MRPPPDLFDEPSYIISIPHLTAVEHCILQTALGFTLLGRTDTARDFVELYYSRPALQNLEFAGLRALVPYWRETCFPAGIPDRMKTDEFWDECIRSKQQQGLQWPWYMPLDQRTEDEAGLAAIMSPGKDRYGQLIRPARIVALDLAIKLAEKQNVEPAHDAKVLDNLASIAQHFHGSKEHALLVDSPSRTSLFMSGALAKIWRFSDQELDSRAAALLAAARQRFLRGPSVEFPKTISGLLQSCNDNTVTRSALDQDIEEKPTSLYKPPAEEQEISDLEQRIGIVLPDDFKAFLRISNGFGEIWNGYFPGPPLRSTAEIDWLEYSEYELMADQLNLTWLEDHRTTVEELPTPPIFDNVICVASEDIDDIWLIPPPMVQQMRDHHKKVYNLVNEEGKRIIERAVDDFAGSWHDWENQEWNCCSWSCGGVANLESFKSFTAWLESSSWEAAYQGKKGT